MKFKPLRTVPAATELLIGASAGFPDGMGRSWFAGEGVRGVLKGCAAPVEVAAGGLCDDEEGPCRGAACVALLGDSVAAAGLVEEMFRNVTWETRSAVREASLRYRSAARMQRLQIIVGVKRISMLR